MKKVFTILALAVTLSATAHGKPKADFKASAEKAKAATDKELKSKIDELQMVKISVDTVDVLNAAKFIKVNGKTIDVAMLNSALLIVSNKDVEAFLTGIQEYPAKIANPFTQYFLKFFGLTIAEHPKSAQK